MTTLSIPKTWPIPVAALGLAALVGWTAGAQDPATPATTPAPAPAPAEVKAEPGSKPATVPFELVASNHMVVRAKVNGKGPYRLVFDLGAPITLLGNKAADESEAIPKGTPKSFLMGMRGEGEIKTLEVGDLKAGDLPVVVLDHPTLKALGGFLGRPLDGIIGFTFFARYRTTIDYQARVMTFEPVDFEVRNLVKELPERLSGPKVARSRVLSPSGVWGLTLGETVGDGRGVEVATVKPGSPAEAGGLKPGDVLTTLDGRWTSSPLDAHAAASLAEAGKPVDVVVVREGAETTLTIRPAPGL